MSRLPIQLQPEADRDLYLIFYIPSADAIQIARVIHAARDIPTLLADEIADR